MNQDQVKGRIDQVGGKIKEGVGKAVGNKHLEDKGKVEQVGGKAKATYGDVKEDIKDAVKKPAGGK